MVTVEYEELLGVFEDFRSLLSEFGLSIKSGSWLEIAQMLIRELVTAKNGGKLNEYINNIDRGRRTGLAVHDLQALHRIYPYLASHERNTLLKHKLEQLKKIAPLTQETQKNCEARNVLWELILLARLNSNGFDAHLCERNPDIFAKIGERIYRIECKRLLSSKGSALGENLADAQKQLKNSTLRGEGVIALSLESFLRSNKEPLLVVDDLETATRYIKQKMNELRDDYPVLTQEKEFVALTIIHVPIFVWIKSTDHLVAVSCSDFVCSQSKRVFLEEDFSVLNRSG